MPQADYDYDAVVVGAGWAGLAVSNARKSAGLRHIVFERHRICETWRAQRWNSFHMNTPNVQTVMPGETYRGQPAQKACVSVPGIYFAGLDTSESFKAGTILVAEEASRRILDHVLLRREAG